MPKLLLIHDQDGIAFVAPHLVVEKATLSDAGISAGGKLQPKQKKKPKKIPSMKASMKAER